MDGGPSLHPLLELLYASVESDAHWPSFLQLLAHHCHAPAAMLFMHDYRCGQVPFTASSGVDPALESAYRTRLGALNPWVAEQEQHPEGSVVLSHTLKSDANICASEYYADFLHPHGFRNGIGSTILRGRDCAVKLGILRGGALGPMGTAEVKVMLDLMPSLQTAMKLRGRLAELQSRNRLQWEVIDALPFGLVLLDACGRVYSMNRAAIRIVEMEDGIFVDAGGRLEASVAESRKKLDAFISSIIGGDNFCSAVSIFRLRRPSGKQSLSVQIYPAQQTSLAEGGTVRVAVFICDPEHRLEGLAPRLCNLFGFTPAEARLASCMVNGFTLRDAAKQLNLAESTVRFMSKQLYAKSGTRGQPELLRLIMNSAAVLGALHPAATNLE